MSRQSNPTNQSNRGKTPFCAYCKAEGHWMKNFEKITCPKLKEKKQKQKLDRQATKTEKVYETSAVKKEIETKNNFDVFKQMIEQQEQAEAAQEAIQSQQEAVKQLKRDKKKENKKKKRQSQQVYYDMPEDLK